MESKETGRKERVGWMSWAICRKGDQSGSSERLRRFMVHKRWSNYHQGY